MIHSASTRDSGRAYLLASAAVLQQVAETCLDSILDAARLMAETLRSGGRLLVCGNGGSAAESQHLASELVGVLRHDNPRPALAAIALTTDTSILTAVANDFGYEKVFERQVEALGRSGDALLGISTSGNSGSVLRALERARSEGMRTIALTGGTGGKAEKLADVAIRVPSEDGQHIQEAHLAIEHLLVSLVEKELFGSEPRPLASGPPKVF